MIRRTIQNQLQAWFNRENRKPLILRGARQVGKTTVVEHFARNFQQFLSFNLEMKEDRDLFEQELSFEKLVQALFFSRNCSIKEASSLIFIDEIQHSGKAILSLRYFYEKYPDIPVIAAGSLLEAVMDKYKTSFPVGRVEYLYMHPLTFQEYLGALNETAAAEAFETVPLPEYAHAKILELFHEYSLLGGMPEVINSRIEQNDLIETSRIYESLMTSYVDDAAKYSSGKSSFHVLRHAIETAPLESGSRIKFQGFGNSAYRSREMGEALRTLERAMLIHLLYPVTAYEAPLLPDKKKSPRLQFLDTGLMNYRAGLQASLLNIRDLNDLYRGRIAEQVVGQELLALFSEKLVPPLFWVREKKGSQAEVDFLFHYKNKNIPVEVKSGPTGKLRSLHQFISRSGMDTAIRLYPGKIRIDLLKTPEGASYRLISLPYYLAVKLEHYLEWAEGEKPQPAR